MLSPSIKLRLGRSISSRVVPSLQSFPHTQRYYSDRPPTGSFATTPTHPSSSSSSSPSSHETHRMGAGEGRARSVGGAGAGGDRVGRTTHFGFKDIREEEKETLVGSVFSSVASSYDVMNDAMSLGIHRLWKDHFVSKLDPRGGINILDVAGGTGDIALRMLDHARLKHYDRETKVTILDINPNMLSQGQKRMKQTMYWNTPQLSFQLGNAEMLGTPIEVPPQFSSPSIAPNSKKPYLPPLESKPIESESVDLYTIAFGIRNCTHIDKVLEEAYRVLKPGGVFACLEFGKVSVPLLAELYKQYSFNLIPTLGQLLAGDRDSYQYLIESIERFPTQPEFARMISRAGFHLPNSQVARDLGLPSFPKGSATRGDEDVDGAWEDLTLGIASIWTGIKL
ncbi:hypothetical protein IE53DRAFT_97813 [Violaceomyces palustris]|uniref:Uncharacterized protein n=1 Tax=Violaceomyces palustris TaxID=1673888 RepID=A0ACD0NX33_9BASI|nr:hypothetical protein IE53DRAFT_97813 [Violaceomyces palustris]